MPSIVNVGPPRTSNSLLGSNQGATGAFRNALNSYREDISSNRSPNQISSKPALSPPVNFGNTLSAKPYQISTGEPIRQAPVQVPMQTPIQTPVVQQDPNQQNFLQHKPMQQTGGLPFDFTNFLQQLMSNPSIMQQIFSGRLLGGV